MVRPARYELFLPDGAVSDSVSVEQTKGSPLIDWRPVPKGETGSPLKVTGPPPPEQYKAYSQRALPPSPTTPPAWGRSGSRISQRKTSRPKSVQIQGWAANLMGGKPGNRKSILSDKSRAPTPLTGRSLDLSLESSWIDVPSPKRSPAKLKRKRGRGKAKSSISLSRTVSKAATISRSTTRSTASTTSSLPPKKLAKRSTFLWARGPQGENHQDLLSTGFFERLEALPKRRIIRTPVVPALKIPTRRVSFRAHSILPTPTNFYATSTNRMSRASWSSSSSIRLSKYLETALSTALLPHSLTIVRPQRFSGQLEAVLDQMMAKPHQADESGGCLALGELPKAADERQRQIAVEVPAGMAFTRSDRQKPPAPGTKTNSEHEGQDRARLEDARTEIAVLVEEVANSSMQKDKLPADGDGLETRPGNNVEGNAQVEAVEVIDDAAGGESEKLAEVDGAWQVDQAKAELRTGGKERQIYYQHGQIKLNNNPGLMGSIASIAPWVIYDVEAENEKADDAVMDDIVSFFTAAPAQEQEQEEGVTGHPSRPVSAPEVDAFLAEESAVRSSPLKTVRVPGQAKEDDVAAGTIKPWVVSECIGT